MKHIYLAIFDRQTGEEVIRYNARDFFFKVQSNGVWIYSRVNGNLRGAYSIQLYDVREAYD